MIRPADMITVLPAGSPRETRDADQDWGGFILSERSNRLVHIKLTGRLSKATLNRTHRAVLGLSPTDGPRFVLLDGEALEHIPLDVAKAFADMESSLARREVVLLWCSLTPYLANILVVSGIDGDALPCFSDSSGALRAMRAVQSDTPGTARIRLAAWGCLRH